MQTEVRACQNCKNEFAIEPDDFDFYSSINVPPPTFCPQCRMQRRMVARNERALYRRACELCKKQMISMYSPDKPFTVYCRDCWYGDGWDPLDYGADYDFSKPFFRQFRELMERVPRIGLMHLGNSNVNCDYTNFVFNSKNVYLAFSVVQSENIYYSRLLDRSKDCVDCYHANETELCYENVDASRNYRCIFTLDTRDCLDSSFIYDCTNCQNCFMSSNLRNRQYVFRNKQYAKEDYQRAIEELGMGKYENLAALKKEFAELRKKSFHRFANVFKANDSTGNNLENVKRAVCAFDSYNLENVKYFVRSFSTKDSYDVLGTAHSERIFEAVSAGFGSYNARFITFGNASRDMTYADWSQDGSNLFGCIGVRNRHHCILNKQYGKEEYERLVPKIVKHMNDMPYKDKAGRTYGYGEFYPIEIMPFAYNETIAYEFYPLTKEEALAQGYGWRDPDPYVHAPTIKAESLPADIKDAPNSVISEIVGCPECGRAYRILEPELSLLRKFNVALPRKCQDCRHRDRFLMRNPYKLWRRRCMCSGANSEGQIAYPNTAKHPHGDGPCPNEFETSYAPERPEKVYCEQCYNAEIV